MAVSPETSFKLFQMIIITTLKVGEGEKRRQGEPLQVAILYIIKLGHS